MSLAVPIVKWSPHASTPEVEAFLKRPALDPVALDAACVALV